MIVSSGMGHGRLEHRDVNMTVCIAARSQGMILLASDRMITAGDIQFEHPTSKTMFLTSSIAVMYSGDSALHAEIYQDLMVDVAKRIAEEPTNWLNVKDMAYLYLQYWNRAKMLRAEAAVLAPLGLNLDSFFSRQSTFDVDFTIRLTSDIVNYAMERLSVIVTGIDQRFGADSPCPSIYRISNASNSSQAEIYCADTAGFCAVGIGANHAESQFMLAEYSNRVPNGEALLLLFSAKKAAEIAPGVGRTTDFFALGANVGMRQEIPVELVAKLETEYNNIRKKDELARKKGRVTISKYLEAISTSEKQKQTMTAPPVAALSPNASSPEPSVQPDPQAQ